MKAIMQEILENILPEQDITRRISPVLSAIQKGIESTGADASVQIGGSIAKSTYLRGDHDCDLFVRFSPDTDGDALSDILERIMKKTGYPYERVHGSRDYFTFTKSSIHFEIVPVIRISDPKEASNVTDCSPLHSTWVRKHAKRQVQGFPLHDHIRVLKALCKAQRIYGAESYIGGLSGHVIDILVLHYGGFEATLKAVSQWKKKTYLDPEGHYTDQKEAMTALDTTKTSVPLILVDPIDCSRNAAAAVGREKYDAFRRLAEAFLTSPSASFFIHEPLHAKSWGLPSQEVITLHMDPLDGKKDVVGAKMKKCIEHMAKSMTQYGFTVPSWTFWWDGRTQGVGLLHVPVQHIPKTYEHEGPFINDKERSEAFKQKHGDVYTRGKRLYTKCTREHTTAFSYMKAVSRQAYIRERIKSIQIFT